MRGIVARFSLRVQLFVVFLLLFAITFGGASYLFYSTTSAQETANLRKDMITTATSLAGRLDPAAVVSVHTAHAMNAEYKALQQQLVYLSKANPRVFGAYIFMLDPGHPTLMQWVVTSNLHPHCKCNVTKLLYTTTSENRQSMITAFTHPTTSPSIYTDIYGAWFSGYAPIRNAKGQAVAIAEVDMTAQSVIDIQNSIKHASVLVFLIVLAGLAVVIPALAAFITRPLKSVTAAARALELGTAPDRASLAHATQGNDEVSQLARVFTRMADEVQSREQQLKRQVEELRIEIDLAKQETQVAEITETDFFRGLQQKAQLMRARTAEAKLAL